MMKKLIFAFVILLALSCSEKESENYSFEVEYKGSLGVIMDEADISAKADLNDYGSIEHLYGLGSVENLKGEIMIFDHDPFVTSMQVIGQDSTMFMDNSFNKKASLFVYTSVKKWTSINIPDDITTYEQFEIYVEQAAQGNGIDTEKPFPFLVEGNVSSFDWHVIDWPEGDTIHTHEKHQNSGLHGTLTNQDADILGFYSKHHHQIFTHHSTNMHMHIKTIDNSVAGHLDRIVFGHGMILKVPSV